LIDCVGLNDHAVQVPTARSKEAEAMRDTSRAPPQGRRARSAERYERLRVNESKRLEFNGWEN